MILAPYIALFMRNFVLFCFVSVFTALCGTHVSAEDKDIPVLRVLNWSEYIVLDEAMDDGRVMEERSFAIREFAEEFGCKVEYFEYEETAEAIARLEKSEGFYDVIVASSGEVKRMGDGGLIDRIDRKLVPNYRYVSIYYDAIESQREIWEYAMPHLYGTTGIAYRKDLCEAPVTSLSQFFSADFSSDQKRAILNDSQVMFGLASLHLDNDPNEDRKHNHKEAARLLYGMKSDKILDVISTNVELLSEELAAGAVAMAIMYSGDALALANTHELVEYVIPEDGAEYYIDSFVISSSSKKKELAHSFINFMLRPEISARESMGLLYPTFNLAALSIVESKAPQQLLNESIYPLPETIQSLHEFSLHSASQAQHWNWFLDED